MKEGRHRTQDIFLNKQYISISRGIMDLQKMEEFLLNDTKLLKMYAIYVQFSTIVYFKSLISFINVQVAQFRTGIILG